jgi:hypothetical protein
MEKAKLPHKRLTTTWAFKVPWTHTLNYWKKEHRGDQMTCRSIAERLLRLGLAAKEKTYSGCYQGEKVWDEEGMVRCWNTASGSKI